MNGHDLESGEGANEAAAPDVSGQVAEPAAETPPAVQRFRSCRWRKAAEAATPDHCTHRDVQPMAGTAGFSAESWCPECGHYKVRRNPRKRPAVPSEDRYYY